MFRRNTAVWIIACAVIAAATLGGCARAKRDTTGFAMSNSETVPAGFEDTWQAVKHVLREGGYDLYTRDKRGTFVAYSKEHRHLLQPQRLKYTIEVLPVADKETQIQIEAVKQVYGVTLLTYPDWYDRKLSEDKGVQEILDAVKAKVAEPAGAPATVEATPAPGS